MKKIKLYLIIGILIIHICLQNSTLGQETNITYPSNNDLQSLSQQSQIIIIERIEDGLGLTIYIKNIGDGPVQNLYAGDLLVRKEADL